MLSLHCKVLFQTMPGACWLESRPSIQTDLFSSLSYQQFALLCVTMVMRVNSNSVRGGVVEESEWGPAIRELPCPWCSLIFQQVCTCLGCKLHNIGGAEHRVSAWTNCLSCLGQSQQSPYVGAVQPWQLQLGTLIKISSQKHSCNITVEFCIIISVGVSVETHSEVTEDKLILAPDWF